MVSHCDANKKQTVRAKTSEKRNLNDKQAPYDCTG